MKKLILLFAVSSCALAAFSQKYNPDKVNKKAAVLYSNALDELTQTRDYKKGLELLDQSLKIDPDFLDAYLTKAGVYAELKIYKSSAEEFEKAFGLDSAYTREFLLPYSISLAGTGRFDQALNAINRFLEIPGLNERSQKAGDYRKKCFEFAVNLDKEKKLSNYIFTLQNLGDSINTSESEYFPSLTVDGQELVFTRRVKNFNEDFYSSQWHNGNWSKAKSLPGNINTDRNEGAQNISQDGKMLVFTGCNFQDGYGSCDIYFSLLNKNGWSAPQNIGNSINSEFWESQPCLSPDKRALYFAARDPSGLGGSDLYVSYILPNGKWGTPLNMGPGINTAGDESCPFIHADNQTLYFTSTGLPGYGGSDLFVVRKDSTGHWGNPENLGYPINTIDDEGTLFIASDGKTAYYSSDRSDSRGGLDIYKFELRDDVRPFKTLWVKGKVFDKKTEEGLPSTLELADVATGQRISKVQTDEIGEYLITLPVGKDYAFNVERKGYLFYSENFNLSNNYQDSTYIINIPLQPIEVNATVVLRNVFFDVNKFDLKPQSIVELDKLVQLLSDNPALKILISGHTDNTGNEKDNLTLSNNRAKAVVDYLVSKGIGAPRLSYEGFGDTHPVAGNDTESGRALNRRTEMKVTGQ